MTSIRTVEDRLRVRAFHAFYRHHENEPDPVTRFVRALLDSSRPIVNQRAFEEWVEQYAPVDSST